MKNRCIYLVLFTLVLLPSCGSCQLNDAAAASEQESIEEIVSEQESIEETVTFTNLWRSEIFFEEQSIAFSKANSDADIVYADNSGSEEETERVLMDLMRGEGPDILCLETEQMYSLVKNDALGILDTVIAEDNRDAILPGAIEIGTIQGNWYGIPYGLHIDTMAVNCMYWDKPAWKISDVINIMENNSVNSIFVDYGGQDTWEYNLSFLIGRDLANTPFLQNGVPEFDTEEFQDLLRFVKERSGNSEIAPSLKDCAEALNAHEIVGLSCMIDGMDVFGSYRKYLGPHCSFIGYPSESGQGSYLFEQGMFVVNKDSVTKKGVIEFLNYLISLDTQLLIKDQVSIRTDVPEKLWLYDDINDMYFIAFSDGEKILVPEQKDYTTFLTEYMDLIESAVPRKIYDNEDLYDILIEEAESYFEYDKDVKEVTKAIQNRMELYFRERQ